MNIGSIGIIGGQGFIGRALGRAFLDRQIVPPERLLIASRSADCSGWPQGVHCTTDSSWLASEADVVIVSVRPEQFPSLQVKVRDSCLLISVMAGVPVVALTQRTQAVRVVRAMPNAAASIGRSYTPFCANAVVTAEERRFVRKLFEAVGSCGEVRSEDELDYMTGLTGSGPAFVALLAEAMLTHGILRGLDSVLVYEAVLATIEGAAEIVGRGSRSPSEVIDGLVAYRGTTAAAVQAMRQHGFDSIVAGALDAAERRARTMYPDYV